jgi:CDP-6-deoxy-D-xylo-4-hexulose-3-dehydrase
MKKIWYAPNGFEAYGEEEINAVERCLRDGWLAGFGKYTVEFEEKVAKYFGKQYGLFVNSGSSACILALESLNLEKGSEIITPACTFSTTVAPIIQLGYTPVFCDIVVNAYVPSIDQVFEKINERTKVIMLPNLVGNSPNWRGIRERLTEIKRNDIILIEDSADTMICTQESDISTASFYSSHVITACGSGGMVMFNSKEHLLRATMFRDWGRIGNNMEEVSERFNHSIDNIPYDFKFLYGCLGYNFKSSEVNAAFGIIQLKRLPLFLEIRRKNIERFMENLKDVSDIILPDDSKKSNWLAFPILVKNRLGLVTFLENSNIQTRVIFSGNITRHPAYRNYLQGFTNADIIMRDGLLLGCHHGMTLEDVDYVCSHIKDFYKV